MKRMKKLLLDSKKHEIGLEVEAAIKKNGKTDFNKKHYCAVSEKIEKLYQKLAIPRAIPKYGLLLYIQIFESLLIRLSNPNVMPTDR